MLLIILFAVVFLARRAERNRPSTVWTGSSKSVNLRVTPILLINLLSEKASI
jgi:hypothetical protein